MLLVWWAVLGDIIHDNFARGAVETSQVLDPPEPKLKSTRVRRMMWFD